MPGKRTNIAGQLVDLHFGWPRVQPKTKTARQFEFIAVIVQVNWRASAALQVSMAGLLWVP